MTSLSVTPVDYETVVQRFPKAGDRRPPRMAKWRCNLTALSQFRNLYFVACRDEIYVYRPSYPKQKVPSKPAGIIKLAQTRPDIQGYIDFRLPQGVNHLLVRELGLSEILLLACDGGDVIGYYVRDIEKAIQSSKNSACLAVVPFFNENVGNSAWGLDVHTSERLIAVSSNSHDIHVFAFALSGKVEGESRAMPKSSSTDDLVFEHGKLGANGLLSSKWRICTRKSDCYRRQKVDYVWVLEAHEGNIPSIAFHNEEVEDPSRVLLASTDIHGRTNITSIWRRETEGFEFHGK